MATLVTLETTTLLMMDLLCGVIRYGSDYKVIIVIVVRQIQMSFYIPRCIRLINPVTEEKAFHPTR